jgi:hypothetical protein
MSEEETSGKVRISTHTELGLRSQAVEMALRVCTCDPVPPSAATVVDNAAVFLAFLQHGTVPAKPENELQQLAHVLESKLIDVTRAVDGAGLRVNIRPDVYTAEALLGKIKQLLSLVDIKRAEVRGEEALARNVGLLVQAWEAAIRYEDFNRELGVREEPKT